MPAHGGYGRPTRIHEDPAELPTSEPDATLHTECPQCVYNASLNHGSAETFCAYGLITGKARIKLPKREDGRCPAFSSGPAAGGDDP